MWYSYKHLFSKPLIFVKLKYIFTHCIYVQMWYLHFWIAMFSWYFLNKYRHQLFISLKHHIYKEVNVNKVATHNLQAFNICIDESICLLFCIYDQIWYLHFWIAVYSWYFLKKYKHQLFISRKHHIYKELNMNRVATCILHCAINLIRFTNIYKPCKADMQYIPK